MLQCSAFGNYEDVSRRENWLCTRILKFSGSPEMAIFIQICSCYS